MKRLYALIIAAGLCLPSIGAWAWWQSIQQVAVGTVAFQGLGDVQSGAMAFWSCRAYSAATAGTKAYNIIRASDSATTDINSLANGKCDTATPATFCNATTCKIVTYYDQSGALACTGGTACDATQTTDSQRPVWTASIQNGWPCAVGAGTTQDLNTLSVTSSTQPFTWGAVAERTGNFAANGRIISANSTSTNFGFRAASTVGTQGGTISATAADSAFHAVVNGSTVTASASYIIVDGAAAVTGTLGALPVAAGINLMADSTAGASPLTGNFCEGFIYPSLISTGGAANLVTNMRSATSGWNF